MAPQVVVLSGAPLIGGAPLHHSPLVTGADPLRTTAPLAGECALIAQGCEPEHLNHDLRPDDTSLETAWGSLSPQTRRLLGPPKVADAPPLRTEPAVEAGRG